ncbi:hypothetical protein IP81_15145 [Novosphingobium sp. AAP83]|nr:hypothetical protein IP81_15145 [Novosphingobium sp. AAP83]
MVLLCNFSAGDLNQRAFSARQDVPLRRAAELFSEILNTLLTHPQNAKFGYNIIGNADKVER